MAHEISLVISVGSFGLVVGFLSGYALRAYLSLRHRKLRKHNASIDYSVPFGDISECASGVNQYLRRRPGRAVAEPVLKGRSQRRTSLGSPR